MNDSVVCVHVYALPSSYLFIPFRVRFLDALYEALGEKLVIHRAHFAYIHTPDTVRYSGSLRRWLGQPGINWLLTVTSCLLTSTNQPSCCCTHDHSLDDITCPKPPLSRIEQNNRQFLLEKATNYYSPHSSCPLYFH